MWGLGRHTLDVSTHEAPQKHTYSYVGRGRVAPKDSGRVEN